MIPDDAQNTGSDFAESMVERFFGGQLLPFAQRDAGHAAREHAEYDEHGANPSEDGVKASHWHQPNLVYWC